MKTVSPSLLLVAGILLLCPATDAAQRRGNRGAAAVPATGSRHFDISGLTAVNAVGADRSGHPFDTRNATLNVFANPNTAGITFRTSWAAVEPTEGTFDFDKIDSVFTNADAHGKWVDLILIPGFFTPDWALRGVQTVTCAIKYGPGSADSEPRPLPVSWDRTYLSRWFAFLQAIGRRYADRPSLKMIAAAGPTSVSAEMSLPDTAADLVQWRRAAYTSEKYIDAWKQTFAVYASTFPHQYFSLALYPGLPIPDRREATPTREKIIALGVQYPTQFALEEDGLNASRTEEAFGYRAVLDHIGQVATGFMMSTSAFEKSERMGANGDPPLALRKSIDLGMARNAAGRHVDFLEIYEPDITAPEMQSVLQYGASLFTHGPGGGR